MLHFVHGVEPDELECCLIQRRQYSWEYTSIHLSGRNFTGNIAAIKHVNISSHCWAHGRCICVSAELMQCLLCTICQALTHVVSHVYSHWSVRVTVCRIARLTSSCRQRLCLGGKGINMEAYILGLQSIDSRVVLQLIYGVDSCAIATLVYSVINLVIHFLYFFCDHVLICLAVILIVLFVCYFIVLCNLSVASVSVLSYDIFFFLYLVLSESHGIEIHLFHHEGR